MITIALINMKGGVGKTTLTVNLGWNLARRKNKKVLIVDLDPQFNASQYIMDFRVWDKHRQKKGTITNILSDDSVRPKENEEKKGSKDKWFFKELYSVESARGGDKGLWLIPSDLSLAKCVKNPQGVEYRLFRRMEYWEPYFHYTFIDCAPGDTVLTATALMAADYVLVPIKPDRFSIVGYGMMQKVIENFRHDYPDPKYIKDLGVVFTQVRGNSEIEDQCKKDVADQASYVFRTEIKSSTSYLRSVSDQAPVFDTRYARLITRQNIDSLVRELEERIEYLQGSG